MAYGSPSQLHHQVQQVKPSQAESRSIAQVSPIRPPATKRLKVELCRIIPPSSPSQTDPTDASPLKIQKVPTNYHATPLTDSRNSHSRRQ